MAGKQIFDVLHADDFIDESGWTSLEPEGVGHRHAQENQDTGSWTAVPMDRWEGNTYSHEDLQRGPIPAEGDGDGAPE